MDDGRLGDEMTLKGIARQLEGIHSRLGGLGAEVSGIRADLAEVKEEVHGLNGAVDGLGVRMAEGFQRVDEELGAAKVRDEELHGLMTFGLDAREALRESVDARFDATDRKHAQEIGLLQNLLARTSQG